LRLKNPLAQINLLLHLCMQFPYDDSINPFLARAGFRVYAIDDNIPLPIEVVAQVRAALPIQSSCSPDLVLINSEKGCALLIECKASGFSSTTSQALQA